MVVEDCQSWLLCRAAASKPSAAQQPPEGGPGRTHQPALLIPGDQGLDEGSGAATATALGLNPVFGDRLPREAKAVLCEPGAAPSALVFAAVATGRRLVPHATTGGIDGYSSAPPGVRWRPPLLQGCCLAVTRRGWSESTPRLRRLLRALLAHPDVRGDLRVEPGGSDAPTAGRPIWSLLCRCAATHAASHLLLGAGEMEQACRAAPGRLASVTSEVPGRVLRVVPAAGAGAEGGGRPDPFLALDWRGLVGASLPLVGARASHPPPRRSLLMPAIRLLPSAHHLGLSAARAKQRKGGRASPRPDERPPRKQAR